MLTLASKMLSGWMYAVLIGLAAAPQGVHAQSTEAVLNQRRLEYRAARDAYQSSLSALRVVEQRFSTALADIARARRTGNNDALERAYAVAQDRSIPYGAQEERVKEARAALDWARQRLIDAITLRLQELVAQMDAAPSAQQRAQLNTLWVDLDHELKNLEAESGEGFRIDVAVMPQVTFDPRDGPADLQAKAELLERQASVADTLIANTDRAIRQLEERIRVERQRRDFLANAERFDDTRLPVVTGQPGGERTAAIADSTSAGAAAEPLSLEQRVAREKAYRENLVRYRDQLLARAREFRQRIRSQAT